MMKLSEITSNEIIDYVRCDSSEEGMISAIAEAAKQFIASYTGLTVQEMDNYGDIPIAFYTLCAEMYDSRQVSVQNDKINPITIQILNAYSKNFIGR